jgi:hypothetical protein
MKLFIIQLLLQKVFLIRILLLKEYGYYENITEATGISFDHMDIVCGATLDPLCLSIQNKFYSNLWNRLANLK